MNDDVIKFELGDNLLTHGALSYLRFATHKCKNCILARSGSCHIYGRIIEYHGEQLEVTPNTECPIIADHVDKVTTEIMALDHIRDSDLLAVTQLARIVGFLAIANKYLTEQGAFVIEGRTVDTQPLMTRVERYEVMLNRIMNDLGLTPKARIQMRLDKKNRKTLGDMIVESKETEDAIS